jgi:hypothetical protein
MKPYSQGAGISSEHEIVGQAFQPDPVHPKVSLERLTYKES